MKKIGIFTINDYMNYGNRLQNYASQEVLKSLGFSVETVINTTSHAKKVSVISKIKNFIHKLNCMSMKEIFSKIIMKIWCCLNKNKISRSKNKRKENFKKFTSMNITETEFSISDADVPDDLSDKFDYFVTGSDQVWNPVFRFGSPLDFLTFAPPSKRIAYAPSFGISALPSEYAESYSTWIAEMSKLSVREKDGAKIIKELTGRDAVVLIDPTLMLTREKWLSVSTTASNKPAKEYLLTYFLGCVTEGHKKKIGSFARKNNLQIVNLGDIKDLETYTAGPGEFIDYIKSARLICTDSFHGIVFSILMQTPFLVFDRINRNDGSLSMNSRINTILNIFQLESRIASKIKDENQVLDIDFSHVAPILECERQKAYNYLKDALHAAVPIGNCIVTAIALLMEMA